ncbi:MAG: LLM class flavin-dependent oxidoreductase [Myxococcota bacterium]
MKIRIGLYQDLFAGGEALADGSFAALLEGAARADQLGLDLFWIDVDVKSRRQGDALVLQACAAAAMRTSALRLLAGPVLLPLHNPLRVAEDVATLDALAGGRLELVFASARGSPFDAPRADDLEEEITLLRRAWSCQTLEHRGRLHTYTGIDVHPKPLQDGGPPLWIEAGVDLRDAAGSLPGPRAVEVLSRLELGLVLSSLDAAIDFHTGLTRSGEPEGGSLEGDAGRPTRLALRLPWLVDRDSGSPGFGSGRLRAITPDAARREIARAIDRLAGLMELDLFLPCAASGPSPEQWLRSTEWVASQLGPALGV